MDRIVLTKGKIPCIVGFSQGGGVSGNFLKNIIRNLDDLKLYGNDRENGIISALMVDGHVSCFDLVILKYIYDKNHKWTIVFGVPHGTSLWQVVDSIEQNGTYKINLVKKSMRYLHIGLNI